VDARHVAQACRLALEADLERAEVFIVAAADTVMERESRDLMAGSIPKLRCEMSEAVGRCSR
jgi:hypothetical protein